MSRFLYATACIYLGVCFYILNARPGVAAPAPLPVAPAAPLPSHAGAPETAAGGESGGQWFAQIRPRCNPVEVDVGMRNSPPPADFDGRAYQAACYALAGRIDQAREAIRSLPGDQRANAAEILLSIADPVADAGDDRAAGPMMRLVLEFSPDSYIALYHAGMSEYALGERGLAIDHLQHFLRVYGSEDGWRSSAKEVLRKMGA
jgi:tetratricopeptide (TPR) repeat protein